MTREKNRAHLVAIYRGEAPESYEVLKEKVFGKNPSKEVAANKAYRTLVRGPLGGIGKMRKEEKMSWRNEVDKLISCCVTDLLENGLQSQEEFDTWHYETYEKMLKISNSYGASEFLKCGFTYGIAQKWLNIAIKNMIVMELWIEEFEKVKEYLHATVDNIIIDASKGIGINLQSESAWSRWSHDVYMDFQNILRYQLGGELPIMWEFDKWVEDRA